MTLSDSDSSDDDDILSGKPMFNKATKKQSASEKRAFNYLDDLLEKGNERIEKKARMQDLQEGKSIMKEENDESNNEENDSDGESRTECNGSGGDDENKKENENDTKHDGNTVSSTNDDVEDQEDRKAKPSKKGNDNNATANKTPVLHEKFDLENDEYWSKLKKLSRNASASVQESDRRRQNLRDAVDGIDILRHTSGEDLDDKSGDSDLNNENNSGAISSGTGREQIMATGKTTVVGTRKVFGIKHRIASADTNNNDNIQKRGELDLFQNRNDCIKELIRILDSFDKSIPRNLEKYILKLWNDLKGQIVNPIKKARSNNLLPLILEKRKSWGPKSQNGNSTVTISLNLIFWLVRTSASGKVIGIDLSVGAYRMMQRIFDNKVQLTILNSDNILNGNSNFIQKQCFFMNNFVSVLESGFGLWTEEGPPPIECDNINSENPKSEYFDNDLGLQHALNIGSLAFQCNLVKWDGNLLDSCGKESWNLDNEDCVCASAARLVAVLCRCGLDPTFHGCNRLRKAQGCILNAIFDWMEEKFALTDNSNGNSFHCWIHHAAQSAVKLCSNFGTDILADSKFCDDKGLLPLILALGTCQIVDQKKENIVRFFANFSCLAAKMSMGDIVTNWDSNVESNVNALLNDIQGNYDNETRTSSQIDLRYLSIATAEVILELINRTGEDITRNGPRFLSAVTTASCCEQMGIMLFHFYSTQQESSVEIYESKDEAGAMADHFERLEKVCNTLKSQVLSIFVDKNMMRVKELLVTMHGFYRECKTKAEALSNKERDSLSSRRQSSMDMFLEGCSPLDESQDE